MNAKFALLLSVLVLWAVIASPARAQDVQFTDQGAAFAACRADFASRVAGYPGASASNVSYNCGQNAAPRCFNNGATTTCWYVCGIDSPSPTGSFQRDCRTGVNMNISTRYVYAGGTSCSSRPSQVTQFLPLSGSKQCYNGCVVTYLQNGDDETSTRSTTGATCSNTKDLCTAGFFFNSMMGVCQPIEPDCPEGQEKVDGVCKPENQCPEGYVAVTGYTPGAIQQGALYCKKAENECPAGNVKSPEGKCLPGEGQCAAGEARRENGTCGKDANGDGKADDDDDDSSNDPKKSFSGGDSCDAPPSCNGDPIMCGQARIQWRIDCNTRRNVNISGGSCSNVPICTGKDCKAMEYSQLLMQWRTACALEKQQNPSGGEKGQPDWTKVTGDGTSGAGEDPDKPHRTIALGLSQLDGTGFFGGSGACPQFGSVDLGYFGSVNLDQWPWICQFFSAVRIVLIAMGAFIAFGIIAGRVF